MIQRTIPTFVLALAVVGSIGCAGWQASATRTENYSAAIPSEGIVIEGRNGSVQVEAGDFDKVTVDAQLKAYGVDEAAAEALLDEIVVHVEESGGNLRVFADYPSTFRGSVGFVVKTPPAVAVDIKTGNGSVSVDGVVREIKAKTSNGKVSVKNAVGPVNVDTSNGSVDISAVEPTSIVAETSNGKITFRGTLVGNNNRMETSNGSIDVSLAGKPANIEFKTSNGSVTFDGEKVGKSGRQLFGADGSQNDDEAAQLSLRTSNGSITVASIKQ